MIRAFWLAGWLLCAQYAGAAEAPSKAPFRITGVALNSRNGSPIPFCRIFLQPASTVREGQRDRARGAGFQGRGRSQDAEFQADAHGRFQLEPGQAGVWRLQGEARGYRRQSLDAHDGFSAQVVLSAGTPAAAVTLRLDADATVSGAVLDEAGEPVAQAAVQAELVVPMADSATRRSNARAEAFSQTDDRGHYELAGLAPGNYLIRVQGRPWYASQNPARTGSPVVSADPSLDVVYPLTWYPAATDLEHAETLRLAGGEVRQADLHVQPIPAAHLVIPGAAQPELAPGGGLVGGLQASGYQLRRVLSNTDNGLDGQGFVSIDERQDGWDFGGLHPGLYTLQKRSPDGDAEAGALQILVPAGGGPVDLAAAVPLVPLKIAFTGAETDRPPGVTLIDEENGARYSTDGNGRFGGGRRMRTGGGGPGQDDAEPSDHSVTLQVPPHRFRVSVAGNGSAYVTGMQASGAQLVQQAAAAGQTQAGPLLSVPDTAPGKQPPSLTLELADGRAEIDGQSTLAGKPLEGAMVLAVPALLGQPGNFADIRRAETNTDGSFTLSGVTPGAYIVVVLDQGWAVNWRDQTTLARYLGQGVPVDLKPGATVRLVVPAVVP